MSINPPFEDDGRIAGRRPSATVIECPCCGHQGLVRIVRELPKGYDDPNDPISCYRPDQVGWIKADVHWATVKE